MEIIFYNKETTEGFILDILNKHKIYDMNVRVEGTHIILEDEFYLWEDDEVYYFFVDDLFVFTDGNDVPDLLTKEEWVAFNRIFHRIVK